MDAATLPDRQQVTDSTPEGSVAAFATAVDSMYADRLQPATGNDTGSATEAAGPESAMTAIDANSSIARMDMAIRATTDQLSNLGAFQNRLESVVRGADFAIENLTASDSRIHDVNIATQRVDYTPRWACSPRSASICGSSREQEVHKATNTTLMRYIVTGAE